VLALPYRASFGVNQFFFTVQVRNSLLLPQFTTCQRAIFVSINMLLASASTFFLLILTTVTLALPHQPKQSVTPSLGDISQVPSGSQASDPQSPPPKKQPSNQQPPNRQPPTSTNTTINPALVPSFGIQRGIKLPNSADCAGLNNKAIPCQCPPLRDDFIAKLSKFATAGNAFGTPVKFPQGDDKDSSRQRIGALTVTLQNLEGPGKGCPIVSTTFGQLKA
jgi:hypothetical protein